MLMYLTAVVFAMVAGSYAGGAIVPKVLPSYWTVEEKIARHDEGGTASLREIVVQFNADVADGMQWKFIPTQREGQARRKCLAFYTAENQSSTPITGVSTYNVTPMRCLEMQVRLRFSDPLWHYCLKIYWKSPMTPSQSYVCLVNFVIVTLNHH
ncbi:Cytochrome c oxidase assembly protein COX11, mitochondrial [Vitis vinifera]|uniref:Cytochrome c oxidase assembly protein COX11, mitochondrial n=1 Tax=Vitis vinifera TaxID=29760 RepID=A0A438E2A7_VITVI|nr:Cytochrome c oxidase assembly protein COX11, mitochondrial [Vitis vinifera]